MINKKNICNYNYCYGCGICTVSCPHNLISLVLNEKGFYKPFIEDNNKCVECGLCLKACSFSDNRLSSSQGVISSYASWSKDRIVRNECSSGGIAFEIGQSLISKGYLVVGAIYNVKECRCEHVTVNNVDSLKLTRGSKYLQSYTAEALSELGFTNRTVFFGTPCQVDSLRRLVRLKHKEENFVFVDFFCHGVPSYIVWHKYIETIKKDIGTINSVSWRNKEKGWQDSWAMVIEGEKGSIRSALSDGDPFYSVFLSDTCLNRACYFNCKFKGVKSSADIRIGDLWAGEYSTNKQGVSGVIAFSNKGLQVLKEINCELIPREVNIVTEGQMLKPASYNAYVRLVQKLLYRDCNFNKVVLLSKVYMNIINYSRLLLDPIGTIKKIKKRLL